MLLQWEREDAIGTGLRISQMIEAVHKDMESFPGVLNSFSDNLLRDTDNIFILIVT